MRDERRNTERLFFLLTVYHSCNKSRHDPSQPSPAGALIPRCRCAPFRCCQSSIGCFSGRGRLANTATNVLSHSRICCRRCRRSRRAKSDERRCFSCSAATALRANSKRIRLRAESANECGRAMERRRAAAITAIRAESVRAGKRSDSNKRPPLYNCFLNWAST